MEISDKEHWKHVNFEGNMLCSEYAKTIKADGTVHECKASCMQDRGDYDYHELRCGHKYHTRCLRVWLSKKKRLNCAVCGDLPEIDKNKWCHECEDWGHSGMDTRKCPTFQQREREMYEDDDSDADSDSSSECESK